MANETIYGCVEADRTITFSQDDCEYSACIIRDGGVHDQQVAVTIAWPDNCDDTYYGCIDWSTRKFQVSVPDNCCWSPSIKGNCHHCATPSNMPEEIRISVGGSSANGACFQQHIVSTGSQNGSFTLAHYITPGFDHEFCFYRFIDTNASGNVGIYVGADCETLVATQPINWLNHIIQFLSDSRIFYNLSINYGEGLTTGGIQALANLNDQMDCSGEYGSWDFDSIIFDNIGFGIGIYFP